MKGSSLSVESAPDPISRVSPEPVRVMLLIDTLVAGGKERQLVELVKGLSLRDDVHAVLVILSEKIEYEEVRGLKVPLYTFRRKTERDLGVLWKMVRLAREFRPDVIHSWELMCSVYAVPLKIAVGAKLVNGTVRNAPARIRAFSRLSV
ncbi:MAG: glycosyltransferase, partial [Ignavibacteria bacterium]|nr:glycosyltransferase [Ignavibacteria bacterium]